jgi:hypothetical protein
MRVNTLIYLTIIPYDLALVLQHLHNKNRRYTLKVKLEIPSSTGAELEFFSTE